MERERKFIVEDDRWRATATDPVLITQTYLSSAPVEIRIRLSGDEALMTLKAPTGTAEERLEWEWGIDPAHAAEMLDALPALGSVTKRRFVVLIGETAWEVDEYADANAPLVVAEVEFESASAMHELTVPAWAGAEVTGDHRFSNAALAMEPYSTWGTDLAVP